MYTLARMDLSSCVPKPVTVEDNSISCERKIVVRNNTHYGRKQKKKKWKTPVYT